MNLIGSIKNWLSAPLQVGRGLRPILTLSASLLTACGHDASPGSAPPPATNSQAKSSPPAQAQPAQALPTASFQSFSYEIAATHPHDPLAFTQGLVFLDGGLIESTGLNGASSLRKVDLMTGKVLKKIDVPSEYFAEGMVVLGSKVYQLTWQHKKGFVYDLESFRLEKEFQYDCEGWGLTTDGKSLILSDGTDQIRFLDPTTFQVQRSIKVSLRNRPVLKLNELEFIKGEIYANVWTTDFVVRINPETGLVTGVIDFTGLLPDTDRTPSTDVLNGIAYDEKGDRLFVTGKHWPKLFEVRLIKSGR